MRIDKITLKGFTTYVDEAVLNLAELGSGVIAIAGPNGSGKTTLLEAVPGAIYRKTPSRGSIASLATARDARIELEGENGHPFRIRLDVDSHTGKQEAVIFDAAGEDLAGPKVTEFDRYIAEHLPPIDVYLASYFASQTGAGSVLKMGKGDRRALFGRLLGLERLEVMAGLARDRARATESEMTASRAALDALRSQAADISGLEEQLLAAQKSAAEYKGAEADALSGLDAAIKSRDRLNTITVLAKNAQARLNDTTRRASAAAAEVDRLDRRMDALEKFLDSAGDIRAIQDKVIVATAELEQIRSAGESAATEERKAMDESSRFQLELNNTERKERETSRAVSEAQNSQADANSRLILAEKSTASVPCAGAVADDVRASCSALAGHFRVRDEEKKKIATIEASYPGLKKAYQDAAASRKMIAEKTLAAADRARGAREKAEAIRADYKKRAGALRDFKAKDRSADLQKAEAEAEALRGSIATAAAALDEAKAECDRIQAEIPAVDHVAIKEAEDRVREITAALESAKNESEKYEREIIRIETQLKAAVQIKDRAEVLMVRLAPLERDLSDWRWLGRGLGREGVQALELDAAGPQVSALANELLADAYGSRFQIRFDTQAAKADGKGVKETFDIVVVDSERGREGDGEDLSGGEKVIVGEALGLAVGLFHAQAAGANLGTVCRDETVGALDPENGERYISMLRAFLRVGRVHQLLYVCHAPLLLDMADAIIQVENGRIHVR
jgi:exonuclease SbcC